METFKKIMSYSLLLILTGFQGKILFFKFINLVLKMLKFLGGKTETKHNMSRFHCLEKIIFNTENNLKIKLQSKNILTPGPYPKHNPAKLTSIKETTLSLFCT